MRTEPHKRPGWCPTLENLLSSRGPISIFEPIFKVEDRLRAMWREPLFMEGASSHESIGGSPPHSNLLSHTFPPPHTSPFCPESFGFWVE